MHVPALEVADTADPEVTVVRWPAEDAIRRGLAAIGRPRILLVDEGVAPPDPLDQLEDWLRWPPDPSDLALRATRIGRRAAPPAETEADLDDDGILRRGTRWVAMSETQLPVLRLLLDNLGRVVRFESIAEAYVAAGGSGHTASVRTMLSRVAARVRPLGFELESVRRRGVVLNRVPHGPGS